MHKKLTQADFDKAALLIGCDVAAIKAVAEVESNGGGFLASGEPKILFEGHWFWKFTKGKFGINHFSYPKWTKKYYNLDQHKRLQDAVECDRIAALKAASFGMFQIMGFNFKKAGFSSLQSFINAMYESEGKQLIAFCNFIINTGLADEIREHRWAEFAYFYNGKEYRKNEYDIRLEKAYKKYARTSNK